MNSALVRLAMIAEAVPMVGEHLDDAAVGDTLMGAFAEHALELLLQGL